MYEFLHLVYLPVCLKFQHHTSLFQRRFLFFSENMLIRLNFDTMKGEGLQNGQIVLQLETRRLSTPSSEKEKFQPLATTWKWYWQDQTGGWCEYGHEVR